VIPKPIESMIRGLVKLLIYSNACTCKFTMTPDYKILTMIPKPIESMISGLVKLSICLNACTLSLQ